MMALDRMFGHKLEDDTGVDIAQMPKDECLAVVAEACCELLINVRC